MTPSRLDKLSKNSSELIVYQLGEVKNLLGNLDVKFDSYRSATDQRILELEKFKAAQEERDHAQPKMDIQKIVLAAFAIISTLIAIAFGTKQIP